jgi:hypothetical protein
MTKPMPDEKMFCKNCGERTSFNHCWPNGTVCCTNRDPVKYVRSDLSSTREGDRAIMGQDVDVEMLIHEIIGATQIPPGTTSRHYLRQAIGHLHSTGRICEVPDGWVMMPRELTDDVIDAGRKAWKEYVRENPNWQSGLNASKRTRLKYRIRYKAMIAASTPGGGDNG